MPRKRTRVPRQAATTTASPSQTLVLPRVPSLPGQLLDLVGGRMDLAVGAVVFLIVALVAWRSETLAFGAAAVVGGLAAAWAARRNIDERRSWMLLAAAFASLAIGHLSSPVGVSAPLIAGIGLAELGTLGFSVGAAMCNIAWPEFRRSTARSLATLIDTMTLVAAAGVWVRSGLPPIGAVLPSAAMGRSADLLLPFITACVVAPQVAPSRRTTSFALAFGAGFFLLGEVVASPEVVGAAVGPWPALSVAAGFAVLIAAIASAHSAPAHTELLDDLRAHPPFPAPGILGIAALILAAVWLPRSGPQMPLLLIALAACLGLREVLRIIESRTANERLSASLGLERRLLAMQSESGPDSAPKVALRQSCALAVEVLKADTALAWLAQGDALVLTAAAPERREALAGRQLAVADTEALASRVFRSGRAEACSVSLGARADRFLTTFLAAESLLGVPITHEGSVRGVLVLVRESGKQAFAAFDQQKAALVAGQVAASLRRHELYGELERRLADTVLVHQFVLQAVALRTVSDVGWLLLDSLRQHIPFDTGRVYLTDGRGGLASLRPIANFSARSAPHGDPAESVRLTIPLLYGEHALGHLELTRVGEPFPESDPLIGAVAQQAALAIQNIHLREESGKAAMYRELDRLKTELLNNVSHDLRGPLTNIKLAASDLVESIHSTSRAEQLQELREIEEEADRLKDLLEHLLDLSRMEGGALRLDMDRVDLSRVARDLVAGLERPGFSFACDMTDVQVLGDRRRLRQVVANLLENAVKYSPDGGLIRVAACERPGEVEVSISDQGVGIPRHQWNAIFRPYQRADPGKAEGVSGNGLGLAICKGIIEAHGGRIWVESEPGRGTTFWFTVPPAPPIVDGVD